MDHYLERRDVQAKASIDTAQFGEIEMMDLYYYLGRTRSYPLWDATSGGTIWGIPIVVDDIIYFGACDHIVYAVDLEGNEVWRFKTNGPVNLVTAPAYADGVIYCTSFDHHVYALDARTGRLLWKFASRDKMCAEPLVVEGRVCVGSKDANFYCLDARTGRKLWEFPTKGPVSGSAVSAAGRVYFGSWDCNLYCLNTEGRLLWKFPTKGLIGKKPAVWEGLVFFASMDGMLYAVDAVTGQTRWTFRTKDSMPTATPKVFDGTVYFAATFENSYYALRARDGRPLWKFRTGNLTYGEVTALGGTIYIPACDGKLYAVDRDGKEVWRFSEKESADLGDGLFIHKGRIYIGSRNCKLLCLSMEGKPLWEFRTSLSTIATIDSQATLPLTFTTVVPAQEGAPEKERYRQEFLGDEGGFRSEYKFKSEYAVKSKYTKGRE